MYVLFEKEMGRIRRTDGIFMSNLTKDQQSNLKEILDMIETIDLAKSELRAGYVKESINTMNAIIKDLRAFLVN